LADEVKVIVRSGAVVDFLPAGLTEMEDAYPLLSIHINPNRFHKPLAFISPVTGDFQIHVQTIKAKRTMVTTAPAGMFADLFSALFASKPFVVGDHVLSYVHIFGLLGGLLGALWRELQTTIRPTIRPTIRFSIRSIIG
jgi:hypothetical protein